MRRYLYMLIIGMSVLTACKPQAETSNDPISIVYENTPTAPSNDLTFSPLVISSPCNKNKIKEIAAIDEITLSVTMCESYPSFLDTLTLPFMYVYPSEWIEKASTSPENSTIILEPIGTGPYYLDSWEEVETQVETRFEGEGKERIILSRFENYWGDESLIDKLVIAWAEPGALRLLNLQSGVADYISVLDIDDYDLVESDPSLNRLPVPNPNTMYLGLPNLFDPLGERKKIVLSDIQVRKAIAIGIDRERIMENFYPHGVRLATHFSPISLPFGCEGEKWYDFDLDTANNILDEAGYPKDSNGVRFQTTLYYENVDRIFMSSPSEIALEMSVQLMDNLGIETEIIEMDPDEFSDRLAMGLLDGMYLSGWSPDSPLTLHYVGYHFNEHNYQFGDPQFEIYKYVELASQTNDTEELMQLFTTVNQNIKEFVPLVPIVNSISSDAINIYDVQSLNNVWPSAFGPPDFSQFEIDTSQGIKDSLIYYLTDQPRDGLYCHQATDKNSIYLCKLISEGLFEYREGKPTPLLATSCINNSNFTEFTCTLRPDVTFHDGSLLDANDVIRSWDSSINAMSEYPIRSEDGFTYAAYILGDFMNDE